MCLLLLAASLPDKGRAFCGFYVGKADGALSNEKSQVVLVRKDNRTVISMLNEFKGDLKDFALVVPVPVLLKKDQIHIGDRDLFEKLDAYSTPRLVEYFDPDPCGVRYDGFDMRLGAAAPKAQMAKESRNEERDKALGVSIEAKYTVGEYDILILSAKQSDGLETWLHENGYKLPSGIGGSLKPFIKQDMKFFVAKVNLGEQAKTGAKYLRPLQFAFESPRFGLPIRLGMVNAHGPQDLVVYAITAGGRVETTNYRTVKMPSGMNIPEYVQGNFGDFYRDTFLRQWEKEGRNTAFTEYFWNMNWCDPCAGTPLTPEELQKLGVFWLGDAQTNASYGIAGGSQEVFLTRLHIRYSRATFPEDLVFQETKDQENFQARYILQHAFKGREDCAEAKAYYKQVKQRQETEAVTLAGLTGWDLDKIRDKMGLEKGQGHQWWNKIWTE
ncbi:MAG TPA: DUF2330 domain-containing protein [bacterium]|nr:DUF2330 domain-containing protein [bacterium]